MNRTNLYHALFALAIQILFVLAVWALAYFFPGKIDLRIGWWLGAAAAIIFYGLREYHQRLARIMKGEPAWNVDSTWDIVFPVVAVIAVAYWATSTGFVLPIGLSPAS